MIPAAVSLLSLSLATATLASDLPAQGAFPDRLAYRGLALDESGVALAGRFAVELTYFDGASDSGAALLRERHEGVEIAGGRFTLELGSGAVSAAAPGAAVRSLRDLFARHPEVEMEVTIGGVRQTPRVTLLPAGHSLESRLVLAGRATPNDGKPHAEGYRYRPASSAVQAVALRPAAAGPGSARPRSREGAGPFEIAVHGPWRSRPVRELRASDAAPRAEVAEAEEINPIRHEDLYDAGGVRFGTGTPAEPDPLVERSRLRSPLRTPAPAIEFAGVGNLSGVLPPDPNGAVGPEHYVQVVNSYFQVFLKNGNSAGGPYPTSSLWSGYGGPCETRNDGDAIFLYDRYAGRWILSQFAIPSGNERVCLAISQSSDPLGSYDLYELDTQRFPDYFKLGVWPDPANDALFLTTNSGFQGAYDVYALDRASMIAGLPARPAIFFQSYKNLLMPADANGANLPPPGSPGLLYTFRDGGEPYFSSPPSDSLDLYEFHVDWTTPANSTLTLAQSFTPTSGGLAAFNWTVCGFFESLCLPQPGTAQTVDSGSWWPMFRFQYRRFDDHEALVGSWTVDVTGTPDHAAPRWFELRRAGGPWSIHQQGTHAPDDAHRWEPSIAMDRDGNIGLGYSVVDAESALYPSIRYATRAAGDPPGTLQAEQTLFTGTGAQTHTAARWGDYSSLTVDPVDDCTFWYTNEYVETTGSAPWLTRIGAFTYPGCGGIVVTPSRQEVCGATAGQLAYDVALSGRFDATTDLSVGGCPAGATCGFAPAQVVFPATTSELQVSNLAAVASGIYALTVGATESGNPSDQSETAVVLELWSAAPGTATPTAPANAATAQPIRPTFAWSAAAGAARYTLEVATDAGFANVVYSATALGTSHKVRSDLPSSSTLYWRVVAENACGQAPSATLWFDTVAVAGDCASGKVAQSLYSYGFEAGASGWSSSGTLDSWAQSAAKVHSGAASWHANDPGAITDQKLESPSVALPAGQSPLSLAYWNWRWIENKTATSCFDGAILEVAVGNGNTWTQITSGLTTDPYTGAIDNGYGNPLGGKNGWCGNQDWKRSVVALDAWAGQSVRFRFRLGSDNWPETAFEGWYLDDVEVRSCVPATSIFADGFETANPTRWSAAAP